MVMGFFFVHSIATIDRIVAEVKYDSFQFFALHSRVPPEQQDKAPRPLPQMHRALFATNIAEACLTVQKFGWPWTMAECISVERILYAASTSVNKTVLNGQVAQRENMMAPISCLRQGVNIPPCLKRQRHRSCVCLWRKWCCDYIGSVWSRPIVKWWRSSATCQRRLQVQPSMQR